MLACFYNVKKEKWTVCRHCLFVCFVIRLEIYVKRVFLVYATYYSAGALTCMDGSLRSANEMKAGWY